MLSIVLKPAPKFNEPVRFSSHLHGQILASRHAGVFRVGFDA